MTDVSKCVQCEFDLTSCKCDPKRNVLTGEEFQEWVVEMLSQRIIPIQSTQQDRANARAMIEECLLEEIAESTEDDDLPCPKCNALDGDGCDWCRSDDPYQQ